MKMSGGETSSFFWLTPFWDGYIPGVHFSSVGRGGNVRSGGGGGEISAHFTFVPKVPTLFFFRFGMVVGCGGLSAADI